MSAPTNTADLAPEAAGFDLTLPEIDLTLPEIDLTLPEFDLTLPDLDAGQTRRAQA